MSSLFEKLLHPLPPQQFLDEYWGRKYLHCAASPESPRQPVIPVDAFDRLLQSGILPAGFVDVIRQGVTISAENWSMRSNSGNDQIRVASAERLLELYRSGATLILNRTEASVPEIRHLCRDLASALHAGIHANSYITPPAAQGFPKHTDSHEVLVLQIAGRKSWKVYEDGNVTDVPLTPGDVLYLPRGTPHEASTEEEPSVHLTIGIYPVYGYQLIEELARIASRDAKLQRPVPVHPGSPDVPWLSGEMDRILQEGSGSLIRNLWQAVIEKQDTGWDGRLTDMLYLHALGPDSLVQRRPEIAALRHQEDAVIRVEFAGSQTSVPAFLGGAVDRILESEPFRVRELPGLMTSEQKIEMVRTFVSNGLLEIIRA